jgi:hypothetical protein
MGDPFQVARPFQFDPGLAVGIGGDLDHILAQKERHKRIEIGAEEGGLPVHHQISRSRSTMTVMAAPGATVMIGGRLV